MNPDNLSNLVVFHDERFAIIADQLHFFSTGFWPFIALALLAAEKRGRAPLVIFFIVSLFFWYYVNPSVPFTLLAAIAQYACLELVRIGFNFKGSIEHSNQRALLFAKFAMIPPSSLPLIFFFLGHELIYSNTNGNSSDVNVLYTYFSGIFSIWLECSLAFIVALFNIDKKNRFKHLSLLALVELAIWVGGQFLSIEVATIVILGWRTLLFLVHTLFYFATHLHLKNRRTQNVIWGLGAMICVIVIGFLHYFHQKHLEGENKAIVNSVSAAIKDQINVYLRCIDAGRGLYLASQNVSRDEWQTFVAEVISSHDYPGLEALGVIMQVPQGQLAQFLSITRKDNAPDFSIQEWPEGQGRSLTEDHFISTYHVPIKDDVSLQGYDFSSSAPLLLGIKTALHSKEWAIADMPAFTKGDLINDADLFIFMPVYRNTGQTNGELISIIYAPISYESLFQFTVDQIKGHYGVSMVVNNRTVFAKKLENVHFSQHFATTIPFGETELILNWDLHQHDLAGHFSFLFSVIILTSFGCLVLLFILETQEQFTVEAMALAESRAKELKSTQEALFHASQLSSLGTMASGMAHEINNPLQVILGRSQLIQMKVERNNIVPEEINKALERINEMVERITKIIRGLSTFSRDGSKEAFSSIPVKKIVSDTLDLCREKFKNHEIDLIVDSLPEVSFPMREIQMGQVIINLLNNSYDAIEELPEKWIRIECELDQNWCYLRFTDSGKGIPQDIAKKILTPFFTTKGVGKGTGLGLSISSAIVADHGGELFVNAQCPNTQFVIKLPLGKKI